MESERERVFPPLYLLPKQVFYTCERGARPYTQPYLCRPSGCGRDVQRTCGYSSMRRGHGAPCYINGREARQCHTQSSTSDNRLATDLVPRANHCRLRRSRPPSPGLPPTCRRFPLRRPGVRQRLLGNDRGGDSVGHKKKDRCKFPHKADRATRGKGPADTSVKSPAPRQRPKSVRELCSAPAGVDGRGYHAIRMCNLHEQASNAPLDPDLRPLTHGTSVWQSWEASANTSEACCSRGWRQICTLFRPSFQNQHYQVALFDRVHDVGRVITSLDGKMTLLRQELQDLKEGGNPNVVAAVEVRAAKAQSLAEHLRVELDKANGRRASVEADLEKARSGSTNLERQLADLRERLGDSEGQLRSAKAQVRQMETKLLDLARSKEALREDLPKRAFEEYKESPGFEMGLVRMGRVSLEYGYQLALARLQARHPGVEIKLDPFVTLPEDADVTMADEQPFDDSLPSPEE
ncbi:hypothetical protein B296_00028314 [Ensete ventricosum]|uniref:Uncharacterized protein n=1 Tax=Ensete ventricosum TaxID=4639 RepID=A0A426Y7G0_ENSVE|nr:hypothetical protein B296_00028314 [Ensete ventricosum]